MLANKYDRGLATGVVAAATPLAVLIPAQYHMIIYGILTETSIARLLIAGIIPGIVATAVFHHRDLSALLAQPGLAPLMAGRFPGRCGSRSCAISGHSIPLLFSSSVRSTSAWPPHGGRRFRGLRHAGSGDCPEKAELEIF